MNPKTKNPLAFEMEGTVEHIGETQTFASGFQKREFVLKTDGDYPQSIKFEVVKDKCGHFDGSTPVGSRINVCFNIRGNEYKGKYYTNLVAWKLEEIHTQRASTPQQAAPQQQPQQAPVHNDQDIPF